MPRRKTGTRGEHLFTTQLCWVTARLAVTCLNPINPLNGSLIVCSMLCVGLEGAVATREVPREKNMDLKSMLVNVSKSVTRKTTKGVEI